MIIAFECNADNDVVLFLKDKFKLPIEALHTFGQGEVINAVLNDKAFLGIVDEDKNKSHHNERDKMKEVRSKTYTQLLKRENEDKYLIVVKPDELEVCFLECMRKHGLPSCIGNTPIEIKEKLRKKQSSYHQKFIEELGILFEKSKNSGIKTFIDEIEEIIQELSRLDRK